MRRLEIGPGPQPLGPEWEALQHPAATGKPACADGRCRCGVWGDGRLPFADETFGLVYAAHVLEHVPWNRTQAALAEAHRILTHGGTFEVWVPNFAYLVACYLNRECGDDWRHDNPGDDPMTWLNGRLFTYGPEPNYHKAAFDEASLAAHLKIAGFRDIARIDKTEHERGHRHGPISLGFRAFK